MSLTPSKNCLKICFLESKVTSIPFPYNGLTKQVYRSNLWRQSIADPEEAKEWISLYFDKLDLIGFDTDSIRNDAPNWTMINIQFGYMKIYDTRLNFLVNAWLDNKLSGSQRHELRVAMKHHKCGMRKSKS